MTRLITAILAVALLRLSPAFADTNVDQQATESTSSAAAPSNTVVAQSAPAMVVRGRLESAGGVVNVVAERIERLELAAVTQARNFH